MKSRLCFVERDRVVLRSRYPHRDRGFLRATRAFRLGREDPPVAGPSKRLSRVGSELAGRGRTACGQSLCIRKGLAGVPRCHGAPPLPEGGSRRLAEGWSQGRGRPAYRCREDGRGRERDGARRAEHARRRSDPRPAEAMVLRLARCLRWLGHHRAARRRLPRDNAHHGDHLRLGLHPRRALRGPLRARRLRRGASLARPEERDHREDAPRALRPRPHGHTGEARRRALVATRACGSRRVPPVARRSRRDLPGPVRAGAPPAAAGPSRPAAAWTPR